MDDIEPGSPPLGGIVRQGRAVRARRRFALAGAVAVVAALVVSAPWSLRALAPWSGRPAGPAYRVTVTGPGPAAGRGVIAVVSLEGHRWVLVGVRVHRSRAVCFAMKRPAATGLDGGCVGGSAAPVRRGGPPVVEVTQLASAPLVWFGSVRSDVSLVQVSLSNGQVLGLRPVAAFGAGRASYVAFAAPSSSAVTRITAYSGRSELGYAVPFTGDNQVETLRWLTPGAPAQPHPATYLIGSGSAGGRAWSVHAHLGPWGTCIVGTGTGAMCMPTVPSRLTGGRAARLFSFQGGGPGGVAYVTIAVGPAVSYLSVTTGNGQPARPAIVNAGAARLGVFGQRGNGRVRWAAYSAQGRELASGTAP